MITPKQIAAFIIVKLFDGLKSDGVSSFFLTNYYSLIDNEFAELPTEEKLKIVWAAFDILRYKKLARTKITKLKGNVECRCCFNINIEQKEDATTSTNQIRDR